MVEDYSKARKRGEREFRRAVSEGRYPYLPALDDILDNRQQQNQIPLGVTEIPLSMIVGTKTAGRQNAFSCGFMPLLADKTEFAMKWQNLYLSQLEEGLRDPILAYEYMNRFYVQEGNKRVSVLKAVGSYAISADVIRILPERNGEPDVDIYYEFVDFYTVTKLNDIIFSEKGRYAELAKIMGRDLQTPWPVESVEVLRSAYRAFTNVFEARNGDQLGIPAGDAFLLYLRIFSLDSLLYEGKAKLSDKLARMWKEVLTKTNEHSIELMEVPEDAQAEVPTKSVIRKAFTFTPTYTEKKPLKVAYLYEKDGETSSWTYGHELGRTEVEDSFGGIVHTCKFEHCDTEEKVEEALEQAASDGCELIFTTSAAMMPAALRAAIAHPQLKILNCTINLSQNAVRTYYSRMYEAKFLMGALAAALSDGDRIGYVADYPVYGSIANINAFAIGAALVRPNVKIVLKWSTEKNVDWKKDFSWENITLISGPDFIKPGSEGREYGIYLRRGEELTRLAAPIWQWGKYYELIIRTVLDGTYTAQLSSNDHAINYWYGMSSGVIDVILSKKLSYYSDKLVTILRREIISGDLVPFEGELHSQDGTVMAALGQALTSEEIVRMDWLNDNVEGEIPPTWKLGERAKKTVKISGVKEDKAEV